jgi:hypothetical protein
MAERLGATMEYARRTALGAKWLWRGVRLGVALNRWPLALLSAATPMVLYLMSLSASGGYAEEWLWIEALFIPLAVIVTADGFVGRHERGEMELLLARRSARLLFVALVLPSVMTVALTASILSLVTSAGGPLEAGARAALVFGVTHLLMNLTKSRWFALVFFGLWWLVGLTYASEWSNARPLVAMWHPLRLSGGGDIDPLLEAAVLAFGLLFLALAYAAVGKDERWLR